MYMVYDLKSSGLNFLLITNNGNVIKTRRIIIQFIKVIKNVYFLNTLSFIFFSCLLYFQNNNFHNKIKKQAIIKYLGTVLIFGMLHV